MGYATRDIHEHPEGSDQCFYCGQGLVQGADQPKSPVHPRTRTRDHVVPKSKGGDKKVWACWACNSDKTNLTLDEYRLLLAYRNGMFPDIRIPYWFHGEK